MDGSSAQDASWESAIHGAREALARSRAELARLEVRRAASSKWRDAAVRESALALARRQVRFDLQALRSARLRALNGRIERMRRGAPPPLVVVQTVEMFSVTRAVAASPE